MKKIKGYNIVKEKTNELLVSIEIGNDEVIERDGYKVIPLYEEDMKKDIFEAKLGKVKIKEIDKSEDECNPRICEKCFAENCIGCHKNDMFKAKPEISLRPFKNCKELIEYWYDFTGVINCSPKLFMPTIWVKNKRYGTENLITAFDNNNESIGANVIIQDMGVTMQELFDNFTFLDGSPVGKL